MAPGSTYDPEQDPSVEQPKSNPAMLTPAYCVLPEVEEPCAAAAEATDFTEVVEGMDVAGRWSAVVQDSCCQCHILPEDR